jgi:tRNA(Ile)-lysidine synthase
MYSKFLQNINSQQLFSSNDKILLGISGGVDSVVLTHLVNKLGNKFALAHCNFNLRDFDSDQDEVFVKKLANDLGVKCYLSSFQTKEYANEKGISIEMAARELRYDWFEKLRVDN